MYVREEIREEMKGKEKEERLYYLNGWNVFEGKSPNYRIVFNSEASKTIIVNPKLMRKLSQ